MARKAITDNETQENLRVWEGELFLQSMRKVDEEVLKAGVNAGRELSKSDGNLFLVM